MEHFDVCIIGGSAAGLTAALRVACARPDWRVLLLEQLPRVGKKLLATGNGRCNLSNLSVVQHPYHNREFARTVLEAYPLETVLRFFHGIGLLTETDAEGRIYPLSNTASGVLDALRNALYALRPTVEIRCDSRCGNVEKTPEGFSLCGIHTKKLLLATGGMAAPKQGSDGSGFAILRQLGHTVTALYPALVPLTVKTAPIRALKGIRVHDVCFTAFCGETAIANQRGELLFAQDGLSGIAAMELSACVSRGVIGQGGQCLRANRIELDFLPALQQEELLDFLTQYCKSYPDNAMETLLGGLLPKRVGIAVCVAAGLWQMQRSIGTLSQKERQRVLYTLRHFALEVSGTRDFASAQVTAGGADVAEFYADTLESRLHKGLFCAGELLDVDGGCGGFNLHWAWVSAMAAGDAMVLSTS